jgi:hypothetical protein
LELLFPHYNTFVTPQVFQMTAKGTVGAPTCYNLCSHSTTRTRKKRLFLALKKTLVKKSFLFY